MTTSNTPITVGALSSSCGNFPYSCTDGSRNIDPSVVAAAPSAGNTSAAALAPGFRFHPTDEELSFYYLKCKVCGKCFRFDAIAVVDIYKTEPWDLAEKLGSKRSLH